MDQKYWIVRPAEESLISEAKVHLAYRISKAHLLRGNLPADILGGWMAIEHIDELNALEHLLTEIPAECSRFRYQAVLFALPDRVSESLVSPLDNLCNALTKRGIPVILPLSYASHCKSARYLVSSAISGGSLRVYLEDLIRMHGAQKLVLEHPLTCMEFSMPSQSNTGKPLSESELKNILDRSEIQPFYSSELCLHYCTYQSDHTARFLLYDDARSLSAKMQLGSSFGIKHHLFLYHESKNFSCEL